VNKLSKWFLCGGIALALASCQTTNSEGGSATRDTGGESYIALESNSGLVLSSRNAEGIRNPGGLVQVAAAIVAFDWSEAAGTPLSALAVVPQSVVPLASANPMGLQPGDQIEVRNALYSMLMGSDAAAAETVAYFVGTRLLQQRGGLKSPQDEFLREMTRLSRALGMTRTVFASSHGYENQSRSSASDLARLTVHAMRKSGLAFFVKQKQRTIGFQRAGQPLKFRLQNSNALLGRESIIGLKVDSSVLGGSTGLFCSNRKPIVEKLGDGRARVTPQQLVVVALASPQRDGRALALIQSGWARYEQLKAEMQFNSALPRERLLVPALQ